MKWKHMACLLLLCGMVGGCGWWDSGTDTLPHKEKNDSAQTADESLSDLVDSDWNLKVDDTVKKQIDADNFVYTLKINAKKEFGTDNQGTYKGTIYFKFEHIIPEGGYNFEECPDQAITFTLVPYNEKEYEKFGQKVEPDPLAPLGKYQTMCLQKEMLNGQWKLEIPDESGTIKKEEPRTVKLDLRIAVVGNDVWVDVIEPAASVTGFRGTITAVPVK